MHGTKNEENVKDYERLEFLGDAVLDIVVAEELFRSEIPLNQGQMTRKRTEFVNNEYLSTVFVNLNLGSFIRASLNYSPSVKDRANIVEALFGALFISRGFKMCKLFWAKIQDIMKPYHKVTVQHEEVKLDAIQARVRDVMRMKYKNMGLIAKNPISSLQELCQRNGRALPIYNELEKEGSDHNPLFVFEVTASLFEGESLK
ncbi:MAG: ribonuclease III domain-containing protein, partial [Promethearchaeota archaeon]